MARLKPAAKSADNNRMRPRLRLFLAACVVLLISAAGTVAAADPVRLEIATVEEQAGRMVVTVSAFGADGRPLLGLTGQNFRASLNDQPLPVNDLQTSGTSRTAASIVLAVDVSGSMAGEPMNQAKRALTEFLRGLDPADQVALLAFDARVVLVQDFTNDRALLDQAIARLTPVGDTALYDGVLEAAKKAQSAVGRKLVVLLSDGQATTGLDKRAASIEAARVSGAGVVAVGLGSAIDRAYLNELTAASGGRFLEAATPAALRQAYADLAVAIRSQYTLVLQVPPAIDRSLPAQLLIQATFRADTGQVRRDLPPLAGAVPPPFDLRLTGLAPGQQISGTLALEPVAPPGIALARVEYFVDGQLAFTATQAPFSHALDPAALTAGNHTLRIVASDERGRRGETQLPFIASPPTATSGSSLRVPNAVLGLAALLTFAGGAIYLFYWRRDSRKTSVASRIRPFAVRFAQPVMQPVEGWPEAPPPPPLPVTDRILGRVVVMDEAAIKGGRLDGIREYPIGTAPLTLGSSVSCDVQLNDLEGRIAAEEARLWVQKGRLVYHKLTTLSAMATEGVTSGWQIIESDDDITVGPYRLLFRADLPVIEEPEPAPMTEAAAPPLPELWPRLAEDASLKPSSPDEALRT
jgi:VWFA-related protein